MLAITSGASAAKKYLITSSSQVKDGVISLSDLSPGVRKAIQDTPASSAAAQGQSGPQGSKGDTGEKGAKGDTGATGAEGAKGAKGDTGETGAKGDTGETGAKGDTGETGAKGETGETGAKGETGETGAKGAKGDTGARGPQGFQGFRGATGAQGPKGSAGTSGYEVKTWRYSKDDANSDSGPGYVGVGSGAIATVACSPGKVALSGGYRFMSDGGSGFNAPAVSDGSGVVASFPGRMDWTTNTVKPNDNSGWIVQVNSKVNAADMTLYVVCANASYWAGSQSTVVLGLSQTPPAAHLVGVSKPHTKTRNPTMATTSRFPNPATLIPAIIEVAAAVNKVNDGVLPKTTVDLMQLRAASYWEAPISPATSCAIPKTPRSASTRSPTWRESTDFTESERFALALAEAVHTPQSRQVNGSPTSCTTKPPSTTTNVSSSRSPQFGTAGVLHPARPDRPPDPGRGPHRAVAAVKNTAADSPAYSARVPG